MKTILNQIITIVFSVVLFCLIMIILISNFFTVETMQKNFQNIDVVHEIKKIQNSTTAGTSAEVADLIDTAYTEAENHGIDKELVNTIFNDKETKNFLGLLVGTTTDYVINGKKEDIPTSEDFNKLLDDNIDRWIKESGISISDTKKEVLLIRMKSMSSGIIDNIPNYNTVKNTVNNNVLTTIKLIFSENIKIALSILTITLIIILYLINRKNKSTLKYIGNTLFITSVLMLIVSFSLEDVVAYVLSGYNLTSLINSFVNLMMQKVIIIAIILFIIGLICRIIYSHKQKI